MGAYIVLEMVNFTSLGTLRHDFGSLLFPLFPHTSDVDPQPCLRYVCFLLRCDSLLMYSSIYSY